MVRNKRNRLHNAAQKMACLTNLSGTWVLHIHSQLVGWRQLLVHILQEDRHTTLVSSCLPVARTVDKEIVFDFLLFALYFQLVAVLVSRPADGTIRVQCQDVVYG